MTRGILRAAPAAVLLACAAVHAPGAAAQPVTNLPAQDRVLRARPAPVFQVGREEGQSWETFAGVRQVAFDPQGNLYILDGGNSRIVVVNPQGRFVRQIGRRGQGPGEMSLPTRMTITTDGLLVVSDAGRRAFSIFGRDGRFVRSVAHDPAYGISGMTLAPHPRGGVITTSEAVPVPGVEGRRAGSRLLWYPLTPNSRVTEVFNIPQTGPAPARTATGARNVTFISARKPAFSPGVHWGAFPTGGFALAHTADYAIKVAGPNGALSRVLRRPLQPRPVTAADRRWETERRQQGGSRTVTVGSNGNNSIPAQAQAAIARQLASIEFAPTVPVIRGLAVDRAGRIWVERWARQAGTQGPIDLISPQGAYIGTLSGQEMPDAFSAGGLAAYIETDDMGVQRVAVRRLPQVWQ